MKVESTHTKYEWISDMKKLFENWRKHITEASYEPGRAVADIDTGEDYVEPQMAEKEAMEDLANKFNVQVMFAKTTDGKHIAVTTFEDGETMAYIDEEEMYQDLASRQEMNEELRDYSRGQSRSPDLQIPGYGIMTVQQVERKLARMLQEAAEDAMKDPPQYSHLNNGVIQALHKALKDFKEL